MGERMTEELERDSDLPPFSEESCSADSGPLPAAKSVHERGTLHV